MNNKIELSDDLLESVNAAIGIDCDHSKGTNGTLGVDYDHRFDYCFDNYDAVKEFYMQYHPTMTDQEIIDKMLGEHMITVNTNK